jgi:hypothetical protein
VVLEGRGRVEQAGLKTLPTHLRCFLHHWQLLYLPVSADMGLYCYAAQAYSVSSVTGQDQLSTIQGVVDLGRWRPDLHCSMRSRYPLDHLELAMCCVCPAFEGARRSNRLE